MAAVLFDHAANGTAVHHARRAVPRHRELQDVRHGQPPHRGWAGVDHGGRLDHAQARGLRELADRLFLGLRHHLVRNGVWPGQHLCQGVEPGEEPMSIANTAHSVVEPSPGTRRLAGSLVVLYAVITMIPLIWIVLTSFKSPDDAISYPPKVVFTPSLEGYCNLFTTRTRQTKEYIDALGPPQGECDRITRSRDMVIAGPSNYLPRFINSVVIAFGSTFCAVVLGVLAAYGFSRFRVPLKDDLLFFILSTRMMPPIAVAIPIYLMYRKLGLSDTRVGMILLYTAVNVSLAVWLLKGFMDEIPREYEEAAMVDGYSRLQAFVKVVLPQAITGIAATAIFCLIFAWN